MIAVRIFLSAALAALPASAAQAAPAPFEKPANRPNDRVLDRLKAELAYHSLLVKDVKQDRPGCWVVTAVPASEGREPDPRTFWALGRDRQGALRNLLEQLQSPPVCR